MNGNSTAARIIGVLILSGPGFLSAISAHQTTVGFGPFLILLNSFAVVAIGVLFLPILEKYGKRTAMAYLATRIAEAMLLAVGALGLLAIVPAGQKIAAEGSNTNLAQAVAAMLTQFNSMAYQVGEMMLGLGSLFLCSLLFRSWLVPRHLSVWGLIGYAIFMLGTIAGVFGLHIGLLLSAPSGLFEVALGLWLIIKGFQAEAYRQVSGDRVALTSAND